MIKARASGSKVYLYFVEKGRQARHRIPRNSCYYKMIINVVERENSLLRKMRFIKIHRTVWNLDIGKHMISRYLLDNIAWILSIGSKDKKK